MLIGAGEHSERFYLPALRRMADEGTADLIAVVDLETAVEAVTKRTARHGWSGDLRHFFLRGRGPFPGDEGTRLLSSLARELAIDAVIISTEPEAHAEYLMWALAEGLSVLVDKPVMVRPGVSTSIPAVDALARDVRRLDTALTEYQRDHPHAVAAVMAHRRANALFSKVRSLVRDAFLETGCDITSIVAEHSDGEWRLPDEMASQTYHPMFRGYGVLAQSGYHVLDVICWWLSVNGWDPEFRSEATAIRPPDFAAQVPPDVLVRLFGTDIEERLVSVPTIPAESWGEYDLHAFLRREEAGSIKATVGLHLLHSSFSSRGWPDTAGRNLYWGNGRNGQETFLLQQGPFQALKVLSWQGGSLFDDVGAYEPGGPRHCELHIFRNTHFLPGDPYEKVTLQELESCSSSEGSLGPGKTRVFEEFIDAVSGRDGTVTCSNLREHIPTMEAFVAIYRSLAERVVRETA
ncbi:Gfo/Idh/MocA family oxidoreductase [Nocardia miyunensis]|uniref:Gfo/Idh/MocA family oxidoreductase n=1 Tax=Nocardia miyunensis TaxID=282684 RepID=UPI000AAA7BD6|nr:Gfo/Idh/MocA family oxidoreductase [Nocardia miyunensis]